MDYEEHKDWESALVSLSDAPAVDLRKVADGLGYRKQPRRDELARALVAHPNFGRDAAEQCISSLRALWWGDDPIECRAGWESLERALGPRPQDS
ncbi:hypothetical protein C5B85_07955 [Pseudoclavibacter sp. AY1F1]|uniref:hypothetical protein n=1 Tax=Pseudoclavibacter sp. AY1F1 TaxID=2080583 RepID=UPI000CE7B8DE|nr:hypothetical protein [Pseudoclavibacter sp. AY1F1]PPF45492.1 hypothetical protein C5B85_07955 [Pseudoclavibacter sp. AY1F1]